MSIETKMSITSQYVSNVFNRMNTVHNKPLSHVQIYPMFFFSHLAAATHLISNISQHDKLPFQYKQQQQQQAAVSVLGLYNNKAVHSPHYSNILHCDALFEGK